MKQWSRALTILALCVPFAAQAANIDNGKKLAEQRCAACHGADGNSVNTQWPKLAGQHASYLVQQLQKFKSGERVNAMMAPMAMALSEQDMADVSAYYAAQTVTIGEASPEAVELAQPIYRGGVVDRGVPACSACHGPNGEGNPAAKYPVLSGQHADYVAQRLSAYRDQGRADNADATNIMGTIAAKLKDSEIDALASYINGLGAPAE